MSTQEGAIVQRQGVLKSIANVIMLELAAQDYVGV